jgi:hypothetical protein
VSVGHGVGPRNTDLDPERLAKKSWRYVPPREHGGVGKVDAPGASRRVANPVSALEQELRGAIDALADPGGRSRLLKALPSLLEGVESWGGPQKHEQDDVLVAAALPGNCVVFAANVWPVYDEEQAARPGDIARALCANLACATPTSEVAINILTALTVLLGPEGSSARSSAFALVVVSHWSSPCSTGKTRTSR